MKIEAETARYVREGGTVHFVANHYAVIGTRKVSRLWFNPASGHYVADVGSCFMWTDKPDGEWKIAPNSAPCNRACG